MKNKNELRRKLHNGLILSGMLANVLVIGAIFYFVWTKEPNPEAPSFKYSRYFGNAAPESEKEINSKF